LGFSPAISLNSVGAVATGGGATNTAGYIGRGIAATTVGTAIYGVATGAGGYDPNKVATLQPANSQAPQVNTLPPTSTPTQSPGFAPIQPTTTQVSRPRPRNKPLAQEKVPDFYEQISNTQIYGTPNPSPQQVEERNRQLRMQQMIAQADDSLPQRAPQAVRPKPLTRRQQMLSGRRAAYQAMMARRRSQFRASNPDYRRARVSNNIYSASGGLISRGSDTVPAMLSPGEFVVNKQAASSNLPLLHAMNGGKVGYFQNGGMVGGANTGPNSGSIVLDPQAKSIMTVFMDSLTSFGNSFGSYIDKLAAIKIPDKIEMVGTHTVDVNITGAAAFEAIEQGVKNLINTEIGKRMEVIWNQSGGKLGEPALAKTE
jgi:hypothetical protein